MTGSRMVDRIVALPIRDAGVEASSRVQAGRALAKQILARGSKSFALAGLLLGRGVRDDAAVLYAWCRRADDRIDDAQGAAQARAITDLRAELELVYAAHRAPHEPVLAALAELVHRARLPRVYFDSLLDGFVTDTLAVDFRDWATINRYAYRVAGVVGLMMCHVLGVRDDRCLRSAAELGMAMQVTNICRDVAEDWSRGRRYVPADLLPPGFAPQPGCALTTSDAAAFAPAVATLLARAELLYQSGRQGLGQLGFRSALAIDAAARIYRAIGLVIVMRRHDILAGRAVVGTGSKLFLIATAALHALAGAPARVLRRIVLPRRRLRLPTTIIKESDVAPN